MKLSSYKLLLRPLTPLHVASGEKAVIGIDSAIYRGKLYVVDAECTARMYAKLYGAEALLTSNTRAIDLFRRVLDKYRPGAFGCTPYRLAVELRTRTPRSGAEVSLPQNTLVPGSSIKGALRTALLYALVDSEPGDALERIRKGVSRIVPGQPRSLLGAADPVEWLLKGSKPHGRGRFIYDAARLLAVSDPLRYRASLGLYTFQKIRVDNGRPVSLEHVVALDPGAEIEYELRLYKPSYNTPTGQQWIKSLRETDRAVSIDTLLRGLALFSETQIKSELERIGKRFPRYKGFLEDLGKRRSKNCFPLRLGYGAGHASKTLLPWLRQHDPGLAKWLEELLSRHYGHAWDSLTDTFVEYKGAFLGVGWATLCIEPKEEVMSPG